MSKRESTLSKATPVIESYSDELKALWELAHHEQDLPEKEIA